MKSFLPVGQTFNESQTQVLISDLLRAIQGSNKMAPVQTVDFYCDMLTYFYPVSVAGAGTINAYLPPAAGILGKPYAFKHTTGTGTVTVNRATGSGDKIDGANTQVIAAGNQMVVRSDGVSKWWVESY